MSNATSSRKPSIALVLAGQAAKSAAASSPAHKRFQTLLGKIEKARATLANWQRELPILAQVHARKVMPVRQELLAARRAWAFELETVLSGRRWSRQDEQTLRDLICATVVSVMDLMDAVGTGTDEPDAELKALYNRHSELDFDAGEQQELLSMKALFEEVSGLELGELPVESMEELLERARSRLDEREAGKPSDADPPSQQRRKSKRRSAAQIKADEAQARISQTVREVYRKLASALHPDRLSADMPAAERELYLQRMQRANAAYEAGDLLSLLELQLQIEQIDEARVASIAAEQVQHFNKVLAEQLRELEMEIDGRVHSAMQLCGLTGGRRLDPNKLSDLIQQELSALRGAKLRIAHDRRTLADQGQARRFLSQWRAEQRFIEESRDMSFF